MNRINSYIVLGVGVMSLVSLCFIFVTQFFSCYGKKNEIETVKPVFVDQHKEKLENFVFLIKESHEICLAEEDEDCQEIPDVVPVASASGVVLSTSTSHIFILTANHFCETSDLEKMMGETKIRAFIGSTSRLTSVVAYDQQSDLCLLQGLKYKDENFKRQKIAKEMPLIGEDLINVAAPDGMASPNTRLMFDGKFAGCEDSSCVFTIPATFGSSGSAIYNKNGEIISLLVAATINFENVSMGPHVDLLNFFLQTVESTVDIY